MTSPLRYDASLTCSLNVTDLNGLGGACCDGAGSCAAWDAPRTANRDIAAASNFMSPLSRTTGTHRKPSLYPCSSVARVLAWPHGWRVSR